MNKTILTMLAIISLLACGCGDREARDREKKANPTFMFWCYRKEIVSSEYHVPRMTTPQVATYLQQVLRTVPGYENSSTDLAAQTITVSYQSSVVRKMNFEETIALSGFDVNDRPANPAAKAKLPEELQ